MIFLLAFCRIVCTGGSTLKLTIPHLGNKKKKKHAADKLNKMAACTALRLSSKMFPPESRMARVDRLVGEENGARLAIGWVWLIHRVSEAADTQPVHRSHATYTPGQ